MLFKIGEKTMGDLCCEILRPVSKGHMAELYLAGLKNTEHKFMVKAAGPEEQWQKVLQQEAELLSGLRWNGIPEVFDFVKEESRCYYVMSYYEGITLEQYMHRYREMPEQQVAEVVKVLCRILDYLHHRENPIIHNDIKPSNILLQRSGKIVLLDFGLAGRMTEAHERHFFRGTLGYAAPECWHQRSRADCCTQAESILPGVMRTCPATDIFARGATLYFLLEGREPADCLGKYELSDRFPNKKNRWQPVLNKCTARNPSERYRDAVQVYNDLNKIIF